MKNFILFICSLILFSCSFKSNRGTYQVDIVCNTTDSLKISSLELTNEFTRINFLIDSNCSCFAYPPGSQKAFFIKDASSNKTFKLLNIEGIAIAPNWCNTSKFTLTFEPLPKNLFKFHVIEGTLDYENEMPFTFMNVIIPTKNSK